MEKNWSAFPSQSQALQLFVEQERQTDVLMIIDDQLGRREALLQEMVQSYEEFVHVEWPLSFEDSSPQEETFSDLISTLSPEEQIPIIHVPHMERYFFMDFLEHKMDALDRLNSSMSPILEHNSGILIFWTDSHTSSHLSTHLDSVDFQSIVFPEEQGADSPPIEALPPLPDVIPSPTDMETADLFHQYGRKYAISGQAGKALFHYGKAITLWKELNAPEVIKTLFNTGIVFQQYELWDKALEYYQQASELIIGTNETPAINIPESLRDVLAKSNYQKGRILLVRKEMEAAYQALEEARSYYKASNQGAELAEVLKDLTILFIHQRANDRAIKTAKKSIQLMSEYSPDTLHQRDHMQLARLLEQKGKLEDAILHYEQAAILCANEEHYSDMARCYQQIGAVRQNQLDWEQALEAFQKARDIALKTEDEFLISALEDSVSEMEKKVRKKKGFLGKLFGK